MKCRACLAILIFAVAAAACKARRGDGGSSVKDMNPGSMMNANGDTLERMKDGRKVVVIFYGNDTYATRIKDPAQQNLSALTNLLRTSANGEGDESAKNHLLGLASKLETDWDDFRDIISQNISLLTDRLCTNVGQNYYDSVGGLVVFRNFNNDDSMNAGADYMSQKVRRLRFDTCKPGDNFLTGQTLEVPRIPEFPYMSQPFSHPLVFQKALEAVRERYRPDKYRYILITKSHGSQEIAISPHLSVDITEEVKVHGDQIINAIKQHQGAAGLDPLKSSTDPILEGMDETLKETKAPPSPVGVTKGDYLQILVTLGTGPKDRSMNFPIVLMESCRSDLRYSKDPNINWVLTTYGKGETTGGPNYSDFQLANVGMVYTSDERLSTS